MDARDVFYRSYRQAARVVLAVGCLVAAANMWRLVLAWRRAWDATTTLALILAVVFTAGGGLLLQAAWHRHNRDGPS